MTSNLPIEEILPALKAACAAQPNVVLQAPPGAGKTTRVPLALMEAPWVGGQKILMLEPRRLAARAAATFMAKSLGEAVGETVGYRVRLDQKIGPKTRIEVITEGVLIRQLQQDPALSDVAAVLFDEFHERSLDADLGLALCLDSQTALREDLRLVIMSATLDGDAVARFLGDAPIITSEGRRFPVTEYWRPPTTPAPNPRQRQYQREAQMVSVIEEALVAHEGSILAFLPGQAEIRRVETALKDATLPAGVMICPLYGQQSLSAQDQAIAPAPAGQRKVVLATSIAQTSLTIEGIEVVVDGGQMRQATFDPRSAMTGLETVPVTRAAATQRAGRAGRLKEGVCYRLWSEAAHRGLKEQSDPEILQADLAPLMLELACWGVMNPMDLRWLTPPEAGKVAQARRLLADLGALQGINVAGDIGPQGATLTAHGREMARFGVHPRLAHMMLKGAALGWGPEACAMAALLSERDIFRSGAAAEREITGRLKIIIGALAGEKKFPRDTDHAALKLVVEQARRWSQQLKSSGQQREEAPSADQIYCAGILVGLAYPDRLARRRAGRDSVYHMSSGRGAVLPADDLLGAEEYLAVARLDSGAASSGDGRIFLAAPMGRDILERYFADLITVAEEVAWDKERKTVKAQRVTRLGAVRLKTEPLTPLPDQVSAALLEGVRAEGLGCLAVDKAAEALRARLMFLHENIQDENDLTGDHGWPDMREAALLAGLENWLAPYIIGMTRLSEIQKLSLSDIWVQQLSWEQQQALDKLAPSHIEVPSGSRLPLDYSQSPPVLKVRLQEMFGAVETPCVAGGRITVLIHLLSPAGRPLQITQDLKGFWHNSYPAVRADMRGRYPKHHWPEDPFSVAPTSKIKKRL